MKPSSIALNIHTAAVISRDKLNGGGRHFGVHFPGGEVVDFHPAGVDTQQSMDSWRAVPARLNGLSPQEKSDRLIGALELLQGKSVPTTYSTSTVSTSLTSSRVRQDRKARKSPASQS